MTLKLSRNNVLGPVGNQWASAQKAALGFPTVEQEESAVTSCKSMILTHPFMKECFITWARELGAGIRQEDNKGIRNERWLRVIFSQCVPKLGSSVYLCCDVCLISDPTHATGSSQWAWTTNCMLKKEWDKKGMIWAEWINNERFHWAWTGP